MSLTLSFHQTTMIPHPKNNWYSSNAIQVRGKNEHHKMPLTLSFLLTNLIPYPKNNWYNSTIILVQKQNEHLKMSLKPSIRLTTMKTYLKDNWSESNAQTSRQFSVSVTLIFKNFNQSGKKVTQKLPKTSIIQIAILSRTASSTTRLKATLLQQKFIPSLVRNLSQKSRRHSIC